jgi:hypothetical protein
MLRPQKLGSIALFTLLGAGYFSAFSSLEIPFLLRNYLILVPVQVGVLIYLWGWRRKPARGEFEAEEK